MYCITKRYEIFDFLYVNIITCKRLKIVYTLNEFKDKKEEIDMTDGPIKVNSEIGALKTVLLKRPGKELENLVPDYLDGLLFDDIPYLEVAQKSMTILRRC